jgi:hypothetical protein
VYLNEVKKGLTEFEHCAGKNVFGYETAYATGSKFRNVIIEALEKGRSYQRIHLLCRARKCLQEMTTEARALAEAMQTLSRCPEI